MGRLERHLDTDLIAKMAGGWKPSKPLHVAAYAPREAVSYRAAQRNLVLRGEVRQPWRGIEPTRVAYIPPVRPNVSRKWLP